MILEAIKARGNLLVGASIRTPISGDKLARHSERARRTMLQRSGGLAAAVTGFIGFSALAVDDVVGYCAKESSHAGFIMAATGIVMPIVVRAYASFNSHRYDKRMSKYERKPDSYGTRAAAHALLNYIPD